MSKGLKLFSDKFAEWLKSTHKQEITKIFNQAAEALADDFRASKRKAKPEKIALQLRTNITDTILSRTTKGKFVDWLDKYFEEIAQSLSISESLGLMALHYDVQEDSIDVSGVMVGNEQEADTEVPAELNHTYLAQALQQRGGHEIKVDWSLRYFKTGLVRQELLTTYAFRAIFSLAALPDTLFGKKALEQAIDTIRQT